MHHGLDDGSVRAADPLGPGRGYGKLSTGLRARGRPRRRRARSRAALTRRYVPTTRTWSNSTFEAGLSRSRPAEERAAIVDELFQQYEDAVASAPEDHAMDYFHVYLAVEKAVRPSE